MQLTNISLIGFSLKTVLRHIPRFSILAQPQLLEWPDFIELKKELHPFFIATQAHPEYKSRPLKPHPVFIEFLKAALKNKK